MSLSNWIRESQQRFDNQPRYTAVKESMRDLYIGGLRRFGQTINYGTPIWEKEWDVLILLDACRSDLFEEVYGTDDRIETLNSMNSVGSHSIEWMQKTFRPEFKHEMQETAYVSGNPFSAENVDPSNLLAVEEPWRYAWDDNHGVIFPEDVTDVAIRTYREHKPERLVIHYMQPHYPYLTGDDVCTGASIDRHGDIEPESEFTNLKNGEITLEKHWELYRENLEYVVEHLFETLLTSIDADETIITADHGNLFGKYGVYNHPTYMLFPELKKVPWAQVSTEDTSSYEPTLDEDSQSNTSVEDKLQSLGYVE